MKTAEFFVTVEEGQLTSQRVFNQNLAELESGRYRVLFEKGKKRSLSQNAYYHGVVCPIVRDTLREAGYNEIRTGNDAHEVLKFMFLKKQIVNSDGEYVEIIQSTKKLTTMEFNTYIEEIAHWLAQKFSVVIPPPGTQTSFF